tara:strand:- start:541 stop:726 length:186 start_codon:yes stop_codon:yes gene_type:complete
MEYKIKDLTLYDIKTVNVNYLKKIINEKTTDKNVIKLAKQEIKRRNTKRLINNSLLSKDNF